MLEAMQASREEAPAFSAAASISTWTAGLIVAQLTKVLPDAPRRRPLERSKKTERWASSSVTTVKMRSADAATDTGLSQALAPSSVATACAACAFRSYTAATV